MKKKIVQKMLIALLTTAVFATGITGCGKEKDTAEDREEKRRKSIKIKKTPRKMRILQEKKKQRNRRLNRR